MMMNNQNTFFQNTSGSIPPAVPTGNDSMNDSANSGSNNNNNAADGNGAGSSGDNALSAFLRGGPGGNFMVMPGMMGGSTGNIPNMMAIAMNHNQAPGGAQNPMINMNSLNLDQIKRLQQMAQLQQQANMMPSQQQDASTALLQTYLDQKIQSSRFGDLGAGVGSLQGMQGQNPILGVGAAGTNFLMMNPNIGAAANLAQGGNVSGEMPLPSPHSLFHRDGSRRMRGGVIEPFPEKLHRLLLEVEAAGRGDVISFVAGGRAFAIHKPEKFFKEIVPLYFRQSRLSSFKRQLNLYGFELINTGPARGGYYHELFVKDRPELCRRMRRVAVKVTPKKVDLPDVSETVKEDNPKSSQDNQEEEEEETTAEVNAPEIAA